MRAFVLSAALALALAAPAYGQGCAMCSSGAKAAGEKAQRSLARGVALLMVTTMGMVAGLATLAYRFRNPREGGSEER